MTNQRHFLLTGFLALYSCLACPAFAQAAESPHPSLDDALAVMALSQHWNLMVAEGVSMEPLIREGDLVIVDTKSFDALEAGMIAVYRNSEGQSILHLVQQQVQGAFRTRGLGHAGLDPTLLVRENFQGIVVGLLRPDIRHRTRITGRADNLPIAHCKIPTGPSPGTPAP